ncbi:HD domain-containing protein [Eggerthellaceae bacterium zg-1084]|uniref:HD domain-containing protein n=1 Tax=Berryella wangjianweii TaxID=2734634 RepID=A0A6M8J9C0_9ACTN|nr:HD domain-containing protein [Berryella wangjianweii]NPD31428.1 HD domain-containing protein [Berryella wangjianweii]NPD33073.1 HD domain-containing protein [Eggerthellaceae bacterium zg-997]QKF07939.1 HD domain-containing protein [Berryella wangjianweii]
MSHHSLDIPAFAQAALDALEQDGHEAWLVGGFVRDSLMGRSVSDIDMATSATWRDARAAFEGAGYATHETGVAHGTITVVIDGHAIEVTTFRIDGAYTDARHPESVDFTSSITDDLARRDFTVNALAYHPHRGLLDPYGGAEDIERRLIRAVGDPRKRLSEDALRILRGCRFSSQLGFSIEEQTFRAMLERKSAILSLSRERVAHEIDLLISGEHIRKALLDCIDVLTAAIPELVAAKGFDQKSPFHMYDVLEHTAYVMEEVPGEPLVRWAALLHDIGKPASCFEIDGVRHFRGHPEIGIIIGREVLGRLGYSHTFTRKVLELVRLHDEHIAPTRKGVRRALRELDGDTALFVALCELKRADALAKAPAYRERAETAAALLDMLGRILIDEEPFTRAGLAINGNDVIAAGVPAGPDVARALDAALDAVIDDEVPNSLPELVAFVESWQCSR